MTEMLEPIVQTGVRADCRVQRKSSEAAALRAKHEPRVNLTETTEARDGVWASLGIAAQFWTEAAPISAKNSDSRKGSSSLSRGKR